MGCAQSSNSANGDVDQFMQEEEIKQLRSFKILLLGAGESGKSTVVKQLKMIHKVQMDQAELNLYRVNLHNNTLASMQVFMEAAERFGLGWSQEERPLVDLIKQYNFDDANKLLSTEVGVAISKLWKSTTIQQAYARRAEFWNLDASDYYFENVERFIEEDYVPTEEDCIMARVRTTGIVVTEFDEAGVHFSVVDVAGQRSERKKWIHCFDDVKCLIFVVSLAGYNQVMFEDANHNRMHEELNLFQQIANNPIFQGIPIFLFLNKKDLFEKMIQDTDLSKCFTEYNGGKDTQQALEFIQQEFSKRMEDSKRLHVKHIAARYKKDIKYSWDDLKAVLLAENKKDLDQATKKNKKLEKDKSAKSKK